MFIKEKLEVAKENISERVDQMGCTLRGPWECVVSEVLPASLSYP